MPGNFPCVPEFISQVGCDECKIRPWMSAVPSSPNNRFPPSICDASDHGFSPGASGLANARALQKAADQGGAVWISKPGVYDIAETVLIGSHTSLTFGEGVFLRKVATQGVYSNVFLNKGARTKSWDVGISITGLSLIVNGIDQKFGSIYGLRGQIAFFYVRDLRIERFRCLDLDKLQFAIHVCTFEDLVIHDAVIHGKKDGIHLGCGKRFAIRNCVFQTHDDAVALNAHDYATSNPELGWIEDGIVEECHDLAEPDERRSDGYFCRLLAGGWDDWHSGLQVRQSDTVVSNGRLYRVHAEADGTRMTSQTRPVHASGTQVLDGIPWAMVQDGELRTAGVRNVVFRNIFLRNPRTAFSLHFDDDHYSRSYRHGSPVPVQENILVENVAVLHGEPTDLLSITSPANIVSIHRARLCSNGVVISGDQTSHRGNTTCIDFLGCIFEEAGEMVLLRNTVDGKAISLLTSASVVVHSQFRATVDAGKGKILLNSDLPGACSLKKSDGLFACEKSFSEALGGEDTNSEQRKS